MSAVHTDLLVRLHVDKSGVVWYGDCAEPATNTFHDTWDFFEDDSRLEDLDNAETIRLLGTRDNATLIVKLHERRMSDPKFRGKKIELGSPACVPSQWLRDDPVSVMHHIWQPTAQSNLYGAWHEMTSLDYPTYAMINTFSEHTTKAVPEIALRVAEYHPAWPAITFIRTADDNAACRLLCDIIDPRWYTHPTRPKRLTRLYAYLGLTPQNIAACSGEGQPGYNFNRATNAVRTWYNLRAQKNSREPGDFLLRLMDTKKDNPADGLLRCTQKLVEFVCAVWSDSIRRPHPEVGFKASRFFRDLAEAKAFERHAAEFKRL